MSFVSDLMAKGYSIICIPVFENHDLRSAVLKRARELGYKTFSFYQPSNYLSLTLSIFDRNGEVLSCCDEKPEVKRYRYIGNLETFFFTDDYRYEVLEPPIVIGHDTVEFQENSIKVGCTTVNKETVKKIAEKMGLL